MAPKRGRQGHTRVGEDVQEVKSAALKPERDEEVARSSDMNDVSVVFDVKPAVYENLSNLNSSFRCFRTL